MSEHKHHRLCQLQTTIKPLQPVPKLLLRKKREWSDTNSKRRRRFSRYPIILKTLSHLSSLISLSDMSHFHASTSTKVWVTVVGRLFSEVPAFFLLLSPPPHLPLSIHGWAGSRRRLRRQKKRQSPSVALSSPPPSRFKLLSLSLSLSLSLPFHAFPGKKRRKEREKWFFSSILF